MDKELAKKEDTIVGVPKDAKVQYVVFESENGKEVMMECSQKQKYIVDCYIDSGGSLGYIKVMYRKKFGENLNLTHYNKWMKYSCVKEYIKVRCKDLGYDAGMSK